MEMTTLLIDAGNSRMKWALYRPGQLDKVESVVYPKLFQSSLLAEQLQASWSSFSEGENKPGRILISNVAGQWVLEALEQWANVQFAVKDENRMTLDTIVAQKNAFGVKNAYQQPGMLGADRWAALIAARHLVDGDCCIIDCGSALTTDVITKAGVHQGGTINPGWEMMKMSLVQNTAGIDAAMINDLQRPSGLLGKNTSEAIEAGILAACTGAVSYVVRTYQKGSGVRLHCVLTGGWAEKLLPRLSEQFPAGTFQYEPDWVLKGLAIISDNVVEKSNMKNSGYAK